MIGQGRDDLARRQVGELALIGNGEDLLSFGLTEADGRYTLLAGRGTGILTDTCSSRQRCRVRGEMPTTSQAS